MVGEVVGAKARAYMEVSCGVKGVVVARIEPVKEAGAGVIFRAQRRMVRSEDAENRVTGSVVSSVKSSKEA